MKLMAWTLLATILCSGTTYAGDKRKEAECAVVKEKIRNIESRMRAGYSRAQGERYNEKLRELKAKRYKLCR